MDSLIGPFYPMGGKFYKKSGGEGESWLLPSFFLTDPGIPENI